MCSAGYPLKNEAGETVGFVLADITLSGFVPKLISFSTQYTVALIILVVLFGWFMVRHMNKKMVEPINSIAHAAQTYVSDKSENGHKNNHFAELNINTGDEIEKLAMSMSDMEGEIVKYEDNLTKVTAEKQRIGTELALATRIQADMLPNIFPAFPERSEFTIYASMTPAKEVGGDFYDFFFVDQDKLAIVIADVFGVDRTLQALNKAMDQQPEEILNSVNEAIDDYVGEAEQFDDLTMVCFEYKGK